MEVNQTRPTDVMASKLPPDAPISKQPILMLFVSTRRFQIILNFFFFGNVNFILPTIGEYYGV